ncbi:GrpB family protein [Pedobacter foliorum]|uniref:GrpB family protein n=1 Tax=Pedobacter foliorum TaxID=2739058 RepID=UPI001564629B|nr:GrpB family protein [Pedobacter foliorum]NRF38283.1 GrpB family protein [Pedobacter foliorum]
MASKEVVVVPYSSNWALIFQELSNTFNVHLKDFIIGIEHIGSTSVPGLSAKPIIDLDIIIEDKTNFEEIIRILKELGYNYLGEMGIVGRDAFERISDLSPVDGSGRRWLRHHLYVCTQDSMGLKNHILFRDYLRSNQKVALEYGAIKMELAKKYPFDIDSYIEGKTDFIISILAKNGFDDKILSSIKQQNKTS